MTMGNDDLFDELELFALHIAVLFAGYDLAEASTAEHELDYYGGQP